MKQKLNNNMNSRRVYTEATPLLKELHMNYKGNKTGSSNLRDARYFDNTDGDYQTGCFTCSGCGDTIEYKTEYVFDKVSEQEFINHMQFSEELLTKCKNNLLEQSPSMLKVETGKRYVRRDGQVTVSLKATKEKGDFKFFDINTNNSYLENGRYMRGVTHAFDLISEYVEEKEEDAEDIVNKPKHYTDGKIEVIDFIEDKGFGFHLANAVKYLSRAGKKDPSKTKEDLNKAVWYINRYIETQIKD